MYPLATSDPPVDVEERLKLQIPKYDYVQEKVRERKRLRNLESILKWGIAKYWIGSYNIIL